MDIKQHFNQIQHVHVFNTVHTKLSSQVFLLLHGSVHALTHSAGLFTGPANTAGNRVSNASVRQEHGRLVQHIVQCNSLFSVVSRETCLFCCYENDLTNNKLTDCACVRACVRACVCVCVCVCVWCSIMCMSICLCVRVVCVCGVLSARACVCCVFFTVLITMTVRNTLSSSTTSMR